MQMTNTQKQTHAYTDGACKGNPGKGGWGWVEYRVLSKESILEFYDYGGSGDTTNNKMELMAVIEFLKYAPLGHKQSYFIHSDSQYVLNGLIKDGNGVLQTPGVYSGWMGGWLRKGFKKNEDLWKGLDFIIQKHLRAGTKLEFGYIPGHSGDPGNDHADRLANMGVP
jgi:ribonuclease HI